MILNALKTLLPHDKSIRVSGTATSGVEAEKKYEELHPDVVVMDVYMKPVTGIETARNIIRHHPEAKVLGLSNTYSTDDCTALQQNGAKGYITKTASLTDIINCIKKIYAGELCFVPENLPS